MKGVYTFSCVVLCLIFLAPTLVLTLPPIGEEKFSSLWILGPNHLMEGYPSTVVPGETYEIFLGVNNQMGSLTYYLVKVKIANQSETLPYISTGTPSNLPAVYEYRLFLQNNATWERDFSFAFNEVVFEGNNSRISAISIDGNNVNINKTAKRDTLDNKFYYELFFELWIYNSTISSFQFHHRAVGFRTAI